MASLVPNSANAQGPSYAPGPVEDGGAPELPTVFSAQKCVRLTNEVLALIKNSSLPIYNHTGSDITAGPLVITGYWIGDGYLTNGSTSVGATAISIDTGAEPLPVGSIMRVPGSDLTYTTTSTLSGGSVSITPALDTSLADNSAVTFNAGFTVARNDSNLQAVCFTAVTLPENKLGSGGLFAEFTSALDTSAAAVGDIVYRAGNGTLFLGYNAASSISNPHQIIGRVKTIEVNGVVEGYLGDVYREESPRLRAIYTWALGTAQTIASSSATTVNFNTLIENNGAVTLDDPLPSGVFDIAVDGLYLIDFATTWNTISFSNPIQMDIYSGGVQLLEGSSQIVPGMNCGHSSFIKTMTAGQNLQLIVSHTNGSDLDLNFVKFSIVQLGK